MLNVDGNLFHQHQQKSRCMNSKDIWLKPGGLLEQKPSREVDWVHHQLDQAWKLRIGPGFEVCLVNNWECRNIILSGPSSFLSTKSDERDCFLTLICESLNLDHDFCGYVLIVVIWFVTASIFFIAELIPHSQVWQLESDSSTSQFTQLQVRWGGVTQSISQNSHPQE